MKIPIYHMEISEANGPGRRFVIWVQGCKHHCYHCFNPETHTFKTDNLIDTNSIVNMINQQQDICGVTFSGGEPLEFPLAVSEIIKGINSDLSIILYSGYTLEEVLADQDKTIVMKQCDLSILGRYNDDLPHPYSGKKFVCTTNRVDLDYFRMLHNIEYHIQNNHITKTGIFKTKQYGL